MPDQLCPIHLIKLISRNVLILKKGDFLNLALHKEKIL